MPWRGVGSGGGIDVFNQSGNGSDPNLTIDINDSTISGNEIAGAGGDGGGINTLDGNWLVTNSTISGNTDTAGAQVVGGSRSSPTRRSPDMGSSRHHGEERGHRQVANGGGNVDVQSPSILNVGESIVAGGVFGQVRSTTARSAAVSRCIRSATT